MKRFSIIENHQIFYVMSQSLIAQQSEKSSTFISFIEQILKAFPFSTRNVILSETENHSFPSAYISLKAGHTISQYNSKINALELYSQIFASVTEIAQERDLTFFLQKPERLLFHTA